MAKAYVWQEDDSWYWDDAENHGGFDACVPTGPFTTKSNALNDIIYVLGDSIDDIVIGEKPTHYS